MPPLVVDTIRAGQEPALTELYRRAPWASYQHHPRYTELVPPDGGVRTTLVGYRNGVPRAYANVVERGRRLARLRFGPVFAEPEDAADFIIALVDHYRRRGFFRLEVQLYEPAGRCGELIAYRVAQDCHFTSELSESKATAVIPLASGGDDWSETRLAARHRWSVKKARRLGVRTEPMSESDLPQLSDQYVRMYRSRRLAVDPALVRATMTGMFSFLGETGGLALKMCVADGAMLGGLLIMREGERAFYALGATDPQRRDVPILHLGILESVTWASDAGCTLFDMGGYRLFADAADQLGKINSFKEGFRPQPLFFTRPMRFSLSPAGGLIFDTLRNVRRRVTQIAVARAPVTPDGKRATTG